MRQRREATTLTAKQSVHPRSDFDAGTHALTHIQETGKKGPDVDRAIRLRDESIEHSIKKMMETDAPQKRFVNNEVVAHKVTNYSPAVL